MPYSIAQYFADRKVKKNTLVTTGTPTSVMGKAERLLYEDVVLSVKKMMSPCRVHYNLFFEFGSMKPA